MSTIATNIVSAIDAELAELEQRATRLQEIKRLALNLDETETMPSTPPASANRVAASSSRPAHSRAPKKPAKPQAAPLKLAEARAAASELLADSGETTINKILAKLNRHRTPAAVATIETALEELGAKIARSYRGGHRMPSHPNHQQARGRARPRTGTARPRTKSTRHTSNEPYYARCRNARSHPTPQQPRSTPRSRPCVKPATGYSKQERSRK